MITTPNMGLKRWDSPNDIFSYTDIADNWAAVDSHDHTTGKGVQIPTGGIVNLSITETKIANNAVTSNKLADDSVTADKLAASSVASSALSLTKGSVYNGGSASLSPTNTYVQVLSTGAITVDAPGTLVLSFQGNTEIEVSNNETETVSWRFLDNAALIDQDPFLTQTFRAPASTNIYNMIPVSLLLFHPVTAGSHTITVEGRNTQSPASVIRRRLQWVVL